jgi:GntR family transcriptional regulator
MSGYTHLQKIMNVDQPEFRQTSHTPLYRQVENDLVAQITEGYVAVGQALPPERKLCEIYAVSRITVRRALHELERKGYVQRKQGKGTIISHSRIKREMGQLAGFSEQLKALGHEPGTRLLNLQHKPADSSIAALLDVEEGQPIWIVERLRLADGEVVSLNVSYLKLPPELFLTPLELAVEISLWSLLERKGIRFTEGDIRIASVVASAHDSNLLGVEEGDPLLLAQGVTYSEAGVAVEAFRVLSRADRFLYCIHLVR